MHTLTPQQAAANFIAAAARLLVGAPGHHDALNANVAIICGAPIDPINLLHWTEWVRRAGRPIIYFSFDNDQFTIPTVALVVVTDGQARVFQNCALWMPEGGGAATLIPDSFEWGAYSIGADLTLEYQSNPPVSDAPAGAPGFIRAYRRLLEIAHQQIEDGITYLSRYTHRVAISNSRLVRLDKAGVTFRYKDYRRGSVDRQQIMTLTADEFRGGMPSTAKLS